MKNMNAKDKKEIMKMMLEVMNKNPDAKMVDLVNTAPKTSVDKIPEIIKKMSATELKTQFGLNIFDYKFQGIKDFMTKNNIQSNSKYSPSLNYANKHLIIEKVIKSMNAKQQKAKIAHCKKVIKTKMENPPATLYGKPAQQKQIDSINKNLQAELERWA